MKRKSELPALCVAVKKLRQAYGDTQEEWARRLGLAVMTVSRFETGRAIPRDRDVIAQLMLAAEQRGGLNDEVELFRAAWVAASARMASGVRPLSLTGGLGAFSLQQFRLMAAARTVALYYPSLVAALEETLGPALALVDDALKQAGENGSDLDYSILDQQIMRFADWRALQALTEGEEDQ